MTAIAKTNNPDMQFSTGPTLFRSYSNQSGNLESVTQEGGYEEIGDSIVLSDRYLGQLDNAQLLDLYNSIIHENIHKDCGNNNTNGPTTHPLVYKEAARRTALASPLILDYFNGN